MTFARPAAIAALAVLCFSSAVCGQFAGYGSSAANSGFSTMRYDPNDPRLGYCLKNDCFVGQGPYAHLQCLPLTSSCSLGSWFGGSGMYGYGGGQGYCGGCGDCQGGAGACGGRGCGTAGYGTPGYVKAKAPSAKKSTAAATRKAPRDSARGNATRNAGYRYKF